MGYKESYEAYINLSRRELQGLCKNHNLPANKCQSELAKSLASYFKKKNSSLVDKGGEASLVPAKGKSLEKTSDEEHDKNELRAASPILVESSQECINTEEAIDGIINNVISSTSDVVLKDQDLISQSPTKTDEQAPRLEPSSDNINLNSQSPTKTDEQAPPLEPSTDNINLNSQSLTKCQNHEVPSLCTSNDKSTIRLAVESPTVTETAVKPASFQLFVASNEGINLFVDLNSGPSNWVQTFKDEIGMNPVTQCGSISNLVKDNNSSLSSVFSENIASESVPLESTHTLADIPTQIENKLGGILEGDGNEKMELSKTVEGSEPNSLVPCQNGNKLAGKITDPLTTEELSVVGPADKIVVLDSATAEGGSKEVCEISMSEPNSLVTCQNGDKLAGKITDPLTEELSVGPTDKVVVLDSATDDSLLSSSDMLDDISVPKASDNSELTPVKKLKRALNQGSDELSLNRKHHVVQESNKRNYTKILRSSSALVKDAQQDNIFVTPRRSPRLVPK